MGLEAWRGSEPSAICHLPFWGARSIEASPNSAVFLTGRGLSAKDGPNS